MKIVIAGAGNVGIHLAKLLAGENQDIVLIDESEEKLNRLAPSLHTHSQEGRALSHEISLEYKPSFHFCGYYFIIILSISLMVFDI